MSLATSSRSEIAALQGSAAFAMSLGAKELFHTNFLAFLLESDEDGLDEMRRAIRTALDFASEPNAPSHCVVWREKDNLDLVVVELGFGDPSTPVADEAPGVAATALIGNRWDWTAEQGWAQGDAQEMPFNAALRVADDVKPGLRPTGRVLIVEAKLKSVPTAHQLGEYDSKIAERALRLRYPESTGPAEWSIVVGGNAHGQIERRLLSVAGEDITTDTTTWKGVPWASLHHGMTQVLSGLAGHALATTLKDYVDSLGRLIALAQRSQRLNAEARSTQAPVSYLAMVRQVSDPVFREMRIADLLGKTLFHSWLAATRPRLDADCPTIPGNWTRRDYVHYTRATPGMGVEFARPCSDGGVNNELCLGIQVQGGELRLYVSSKISWPGLEAWVARHLVVWPQWLSATTLGCVPNGLRGSALETAGRKGSSRATNLKVFGVDRFLYSSVAIKPEDSVTKVENEMVRLATYLAALLPNI